MKKWIFLLSMVLALAFISGPASAYVSVKYIYDPTMYDPDVLPEGQTWVILQQTQDVGWDVMVQRQPSGPVDVYPDTLLRPPGLARPTNENKEFEIWTAYPEEPGIYYEEDATFQAFDMYMTFITIVPQINKWGMFEVKPPA